MCRCRINNNCNMNDCNMNNVNTINMTQYENNCECGFDDHSPFPDNYMYGQSYVPMQHMTTTFKSDVGLRMGTIFPELVSPYEPGQSLEEDNFLRCSNDIKEGCNSGM